MRKFISSLILAVTFNTAAFGDQSAPKPTPKKLSPPQTTLVVDETDNNIVLYEKDADVSVHPASLTKLMTLYLTFEALEKGTLTLDQKIPVSHDAAEFGHMKFSLKLKEGQTISVEDAIKGTAIHSANDAAVTLAEATGGGYEERFVVLMNAKAKELGMQHTNFVNANGMPADDQVTTARDMIILAEAVMRDHPKYTKYFEMKEFTYNGITYENHDKILKKVPDVDFGKTGYVNASGNNLVISAKRGDKRIFAVIFGRHGVDDRDRQMEALIGDGFDKVAQMKPATPPDTAVAAAKPVDKTEVPPAVAAVKAPDLVSQKALLTAVDNIPRQQNAAKTDETPLLPLSDEERARLLAETPKPGGKIEGIAENVAVDLSPKNRMPPPPPSAL